MSDCSPLTTAYKPYMQVFSSVNMEFKTAVGLNYGFFCCHSTRYSELQKDCAILTKNLCIILRYKFQKSFLWR